MTPLDLAVGRDGTLYVADYRNGRIRAIDADGTIRTVAGGGPEAGGYEDGINGPQAHLFEPQAVETGPDGEVYFGDDGEFQRVRRLDPDGTVTTVAGGNAVRRRRQRRRRPGHRRQPRTTRRASRSAPTARSTSPTSTADPPRRRPTARSRPSPAAAATRRRTPTASPRAACASTAPWASTSRPTARCYIASASGLSRVSRPFPTTADGELAIPSKDGGEVYFFDASGRHLRTQDGVTGVTLWRFAYDDAGRLASMTDADDRVTRIERDGDGNPTAIVAPGGQRTALEVDGQGRLRKVADPAGAATKLGYDAAGRLSELIDRRGGRHAFGYDEAGRLIRDEDPTGKAQTLSRKETDDGYVVTLTSPEGRKHTWEVGVRPDGDAFLESTDPSGAKTTSWIGIDGVRHQQSADGRDDRGHPGPGPALGLLRPGPAQARPPLAERAHADDHGDAHRHAGRRRPTRCRCRRSPTRSPPTAARRCSATTSPRARRPPPRPRGGSRRRSSTPRATRSRFEPGPGVAPIIYTYDDQGLLRRTEQGSRFSGWEHDERDRPAVGMDNTGRRTELTYDDADRIVAIKRPGGGTERFEYDAEGARTAVVLPGRPAPRAQARRPRRAVGVRPARGRGASSAATTATAG